MGILQALLNAVQPGQQPLPQQQQQQQPPAPGVEEAQLMVVGGGRGDTAAGGSVNSHQLSTSSSGISTTEAPRGATTSLHGADDRHSHPAATGNPVELAQQRAASLQEAALKASLSGC